jgi:geranylgeranyl reductase family protein
LARRVRWHGEADPGDCAMFANALHNVRRAPFAGDWRRTRKSAIMRVLVVGAGPAGGAAAIALARGGATVRVVERSAWPRTKTCGDGISPDGVRIAAELGIDLGDRLPLVAGTMSAPSRVAITSGWPEATPWGAIVERADFDDRLIRAALAAGATFEPRTTVRALTPTAAGVRVDLRRAGGTEAHEDADLVLLAEGATGGLGATLGLGRHRSRLVALRGYVRSERALDPTFGLHFDPAVVPGYAWIFPVSSRYANVGILVDERFSRTRDLRAVLDTWLRESPFSREQLGAHPVVEHLAGGIIPRGRPRRTNGAVFALGDAAGVADPFSAEGIAQAMTTGRSAAAAVLAAAGDIARAARTYRRSLGAFDANARASRRMRLVFPYVVDPLTKRGAIRPKLAYHLSSEGFFRKKSVAEFLWGIARAW